MRTKNYIAEDQSFDRVELRVAMARHDYKQKDLAELIGICHASLSKKIAGKAIFKKNEILKIKQVLKLNGKDLIRIFFKDQKSQI